MEINQIDKDRNLNKQASIIRVFVGNKLFSITESHGELKIHAHHDLITVKPCCLNEILIGTYDTDENIEWVINK
jgi:hypothetical protein